jgi:DNA invertase Pin-like site-specific DNA recombinase
MSTKAPKPMQPLMFGYTRVSTDEQAMSRNGLEAQHETIAAESARRGWDVEYFSDEGVSGKLIAPKLQEVLQLLASGQGDGLVVAKLDRLSRSIVNAANIIESAQAQGWSLVILDLGVDLTTAAGRMMAMNLVNFAQYERELISERTKAALAAKKRRGERIGRPRVATPSVVRRIVQDREAGLTTTLSLPRSRQRKS